MLYLAQLISIAAVLVLLLALVIVGGYSVTAVAAQPAYLTVLGAQALLARRVADPWVFRVPPAGWKAFVCQVIGTVVTWALAEVGYASFATLRAIVAAYWRGGATLPDVATIFIRVPLDIDWKTMPPATASLTCVVGLALLVMLSRALSPSDGKGAFEQLLRSPITLIDRFRL